MVIGDDDWLLPALGELADVEVAMAAIRQAMPSPAAEVTSARSVAVGDACKGSEFSATERMLLRIIGVQARVSSLLVQFLDHQAREAGTAVTGAFLLEQIEVHQAARADLAALDDGLPFDA